jgi:hypothetical protein
MRERVSQMLWLRNNPEARVLLPLCVALGAIACGPSDDQGPTPDGGSNVDAPADRGGADRPLDGTIERENETGATRPDVAINGPDAPLEADAAQDANAVDAGPDASGPEGGSAEGGQTPIVGAQCGCGPGTKLCGADCVRVDDPNYGCAASGCAACNNPQADSETIACSAGACVTVACGSGWGDCNGSLNDGCETDLTLPATCGSCGNTCGPGQVCSDGTCIGACSPPSTQCDQTCANLVTSPQRCGGCASPCRHGLGEAVTCVAGTCRSACQQGHTLCGDRCLDTANHPLNCGACDHACPEGDNGSASCLEGRCYFSCFPDFSACGDACVDLRNDPAHCGGCDVTCSSGLCASGVCQAAGSDQVVTGLSSGASIALDSDWLYWANPDAGTVMRVPPVGGSAETLADGQAKPNGLVLDSCYAYWANTLGGAIMRAKKGGGSPELVVAANQVSYLAVDGNLVYWTVQNGVMTAPKTGGGTATLAYAPTDSGQPVNVASVAVDDGFVYVGGQPNLSNTGIALRFAKAGTTAQFVWRIGTFGPISRLVVDDVNLYGDSGGGPFLVEKSGAWFGNTGVASPFASDTAYVYGTTSIGAGIGIGATAKCSGATGPSNRQRAIPLLPLTGGPLALATGGGYVYYATSAAIARVGALGSPSTPIPNQCP